MKKIVITTSIIFLIFIILVTVSFLRMSDKALFNKKSLEKELMSFKEYKKLKDENIEKLEIITLTDEGMNSDVITKSDSIRYFYNYVKDIKVGKESNTTCEDNTTIYKFYLTKEEIVSVEIECDNIVINTKRYEIIK